MNRTFSDQLLVFEITKRCAIWDSSTSEFYDEQLKKAAWREVVEVFSRPGDSLRAKQNLESYLQMKWEQSRRQSSNEVRQMIVVCKGFMENSTGWHRQNLQNLILALRSCDEFDDEYSSESDKKFILTGITGSDDNSDDSSSSDSSTDSESVNDLSKRLRSILLQNSESDNDTVTVENVHSKNKVKKPGKKAQPPLKEPMSAPKSKETEQPQQESSQSVAPTQPTQSRGTRSSASRRIRRAKTKALRRQKSSSLEFA